MAFTHTLAALLLTLGAFGHPGAALDSDAASLVQGAVHAHAYEDPSWASGRPADHGEEFAPRGFARSGGDMSSSAETESLFDGMVSSLLDGSIGEGAALEEALDGADPHQVQVDGNNANMTDELSNSEPSVAAVTSNANSSIDRKGMLMRIEIRKLAKGSKFFVKFDHGCSPAAGRVMVNCIFKLGERIKYMWAFRGEDNVEEGDSMFIGLTPKLKGPNSMLLKRKAFETTCPACGSMCKTKYGSMKMSFPLARCDTLMDVGFHTNYKVPKEMPEVMFVGRAKMQKKDGTVTTDLNIIWEIGPLAKLEKRASRLSSYAAKP